MPTYVLLLTNKKVNTPHIFTKKMFVHKRDGRKEAVRFDKVTARIQKLAYSLSEHVDTFAVAQKVIEGIYDGVTTSQLDSLAAEIAASMTTRHPDYAILAARIAVSNLHKNTKKSFSETMKDLYEYIDPKTGKKAPLLADDVYAIIEKNKDFLDSTIIYDRDFGYDYFGFKTLEKSYLLKIRGAIAEHPHHADLADGHSAERDDHGAGVQVFRSVDQHHDAGWSGHRHWRAGRLGARLASAAFASDDQRIREHIACNSAGLPPSETPCRTRRRYAQRCARNA